MVCVSTGEFHNADGLFECGPFDPSRPILDAGPPIIYDPAYQVVTIAFIPDPRLQRWNGSQVVEKDQHVLDEQDTDDAWLALRAERNHRLAATDWTHIVDSPLSTDAQLPWGSYRQALRDLPVHTPNPAQVVWPPAPPD